LAVFIYTQGFSVGGLHPAAFPNGVPMPAIKAHGIDCFNLPGKDIVLPAFVEDVEKLKDARAAPGFAHDAGEIFSR
jgi:hypothetical protein